ncbi:MAG: NEW3 domain-containing protein, partial [Bryobacteraceae bacterium]
LAAPRDGDLYTWPNLKVGGLADNPAALRAEFQLKVGDQIIELTRPVENRYVDRELGEKIRPFVVTPPVALDLAERSLVFPDTKPRHVEVLVKANTAAKGEVKLEAPQGWAVSPASLPFELKTPGAERSLSFEVTPPADPAIGKLHASASVGDRTVAVGMNVIQYPHIPPQTTMPSAQADVVRADIKTLAHKIGYIVGAGDDVPAALKQMGCDVTLLSADDISRGDLSKYDAIVAGVRTFNTRPDVRANYERLFDYVRNGGTFVVQYNVLEGGFFGGDPAILANMGPYPIKIGRSERVTVEDAPVTITNPQHVLLNTPNKITPQDFDGWIQERGLYFATEWDPKYETIWTTHDPGEQPLAGGTLYTKLGKGAYIFTAYSWFRELPAGVPGAYRLFANLLSAGKAQ